MVEDKKVDVQKKEELQIKAGEQALKDAGEKIVYTQNGFVNEKLQKAGYQVIASKQLTMLGAKEFALKGKVALNIKALNDAVVANSRMHSRAREIIAKLTMIPSDLELVYDTSVEPHQEVIDMKKRMADEAAAHKSKGKK